MRVGGNWGDTVEKNSEFTSATMDVQADVIISANTTCCCPHSFFPWIKKPFYEPTMEGLNEQIKHFVEWVAPTEEERLMRADVCRRIERVVSNIWPNAVTETIGSTCTDLCVPTSDIDMVIFGVTLSQNCNIDGVQSDANAFAIQCLRKLAKNLEDIAQRNSIEVLDAAKVPIIKMRDRKSGIEVDISFGVTSGKENSKVVLEYCKKYPLVKPLTLVIKYYLKQKFLNNSWSGGIGSYTLVIMIISYLQLHAKNYGETSENTLADHLLGFFGLYGSQFNYVDSVISIVNEGKYLRKSEKNWKNENNPSLLSVEDPHNPDNDVGCIAFKIENAKEAFFQAYNILAESKSHLASPASDESRKSYSDFSCSQPDLNVSQLMWVNYSLQCFRTRIKSIYRSRDTEVATCPIHPTTKIHSSLTLSSTRYFNNGTKPHKHCGPNKDSNKRLSKKANNINNNNYNNYNNNNNTNNYNLNYNYSSSNNNKNCISFHMDENMQHIGKNRPWRSESDSKSHRSQDNIYKIVSTDFPGLAKNAHGLSYDSQVESPSI